MPDGYEKQLALNTNILAPEVQDYLFKHAKIDANQIALSKSPFDSVSGQELSVQLSSRKKAEKKLPDWWSHQGIYYPALLSMEQCSSQKTAAFKASLVQGNHLIDLTGGFGVDCHYFSQRFKEVTHCEYQAELSDIARSNAVPLQTKNIRYLQVDALEYLKNTTETYDCIYVDPARRSAGTKVFQLKDCSPDIVANLDLLFQKSEKIMVKTAPLLDISAGLKELKNVAEIHIISVKNECKELLWILDKSYQGQPKITANTLNEETKQFSFIWGNEKVTAIEKEPVTGDFLYEPDVALLKSGAFQLIAETYKLFRMHAQTQLYHAPSYIPEFPGRIFRIDQIKTAAELKKERNLKGNVIARNYPDKAATLMNKYRIAPDDQHFYLFTQTTGKGKIILQTTILQHY